MFTIVSGKALMHVIYIHKQNNFTSFLFVELLAQYQLTEISTVMCVMFILPNILHCLQTDINVIFVK